MLNILCYFNFARWLTDAAVSKVELLVIANLKKKQKQNEITGVLYDMRK
jgi:hypothetical protein